jgi:hypothetical protein
MRSLNLNHVLEEKIDSLLDDAASWFITRGKADVLLMLCAFSAAFLSIKSFVGFMPETLASACAVMFLLLGGRAYDMTTGRPEGWNRMVGAMTAFLVFSAFIHMRNGF